MAQWEEFNCERMRGLPQADWSNPRDSGAVVACLVQGVYNLQRDRSRNKDLQPQCQNWWHYFHFQIKLELIDEADSSIYGIVYEVKDRQPSQCREAAGPPRYVIAFRGTILQEIRDMKLNLRIITNRLHNDKHRFQHALEYVEQVVDVAGPENVWLAGHSQGAATAMIIGRSMALKGKRLETFLFNPPFLGSLLLKFNAIPYLGKAVQSTTAVVNMGILFFAGSDKRHRQYDQFNELSSWTPRLFVNEGDHICSGYIEHFRTMEILKKVGARMVGNVAAQHSVRRAFKAVRQEDDQQQQQQLVEPSSMQLLPKAYLTVTKTSTKFPKAHLLKQWWDPASVAQAQFVREHDLVGGP